MKQFIVLLFAVVVISIPSNAQRYLPGQRGIQFSYGTVNGIKPQQAFYIGGALSTYKQKDSRWVIGAEYLQKLFDYKQISIPVSQFSIDGGYYSHFLSDPGNTLLLSVGTSVLTGYETSNWGKKLLFDGATLRSEDAFLYGGALTLELEVYLTDRIILLVNARERVVWGSSIGQFSTQLGIGLKYIIN
jgi:hypothetical protein